MDKGVAPSMLNKQAGYGSAPKLYRQYKLDLLFVIKKIKEEEDLKLRGNESGEWKQTQEELEVGVTVNII